MTVSFPSHPFPPLLSAFPLLLLSLSLLSPLPLPSLSPLLFLTGGSTPHRFPLTPTTLSALRPPTPHSTTVSSSQLLGGPSSRTSVATHSSPTSARLQVSNKQTTSKHVNKTINKNNQTTHCLSSARLQVSNKQTTSTHVNKKTINKNNQTTHCLSSERSCRSATSKHNK